MLLKILRTRLWLVLALVITSGIVSAASRGPILRQGAYSLPVSPDPAWGTTVSDAILEVNIYEGLTTYDATGNLVPGAAQRWEVSKDGLHYTFYLRKDLRWSDGSPLTAQQFANTALRVLQGGNENQPTFRYSLLKNADEILHRQKPLSALGVTVVDPHTLRFELTRPTPYFPQLLVTASLPTPGTTATPEPLKPTQWVTNGAYQVSTYNSQTHQYLFTKNPFYHGHDRIYFKTVQLQHYLKPNQAFFALVNGQLDSYDRYSGDHLKAIAAAKKLVKVIPLGASSSTDYLTLNFKDTALKNLQVRQALSMALDRSAIVKALGYSDTQKTFSLAPNYPKLNWQKLPATWAEETLKSRRQRALNLITDAGYGLKHRLALEFLVNKGDANELLAELVRQQWETIGVDLKVISHSTALHYSQYLTKGRFQVARAGWSANIPDPSAFLEVLHQQHKGNYGGWENATYFRELDRLLQQPLSFAQRSAAFLMLETIIQREIPIIPLYHKSHSALLASWLKTVNQQRSGFVLWKHLRPEENPETDKQ